ncbi:FHA domain-containing protein [Rudaeicoccus suwonensis]|uniref:FHA modulated ABC efflux pump with fused ATPase and integral membrane subunit n=1 Tax=Rudaeicoccus suwonensis TaxID=657409 RepID=A0A561E1D3_9MICO|nr:FHA domain-containing protein [Rudaeicoccus suwonensis]TWE09436.1 FHA modulated ABC efflux pump with fused ATPase and integral membrane subunit [Rudaeicoccus suwonensis]
MSITSTIDISCDGRTVPLAEGAAITIGRGLSCDLVITDTLASRRHLELSFVGGNVVVTDLGSSNGTFVDGNRISVPTAIGSGSVVRIGGAAGPLVEVRLSPAGAVRRMPSSPLPVRSSQPADSGIPAAPVVDPTVAPAGQTQLPRTAAPTPPTQTPAAAQSPVSQPLPRKRSSVAALPKVPSHTGVVFDRHSLPSGLIQQRPPMDSGHAMVTGSTPQVMPVEPARQDHSAPGGPITIGRGLENRIVIDDLLASRQHSQLVPAPGGFQVRDLGSRNGTYINGQRIGQGYLGEGDLLAIGHSRFTVRQGQLVASVDEGDVNFVANHLTFTLPGGKKLLDDVSFALEGSSLLAIIGPSGAGKSTMLKALIGSQPATEGEVYYDGRDLYKNFQDLRHRIGVVPQDDVVHRQLTVRQALRFAAELRFPDDLDKELRNKRVEEVMAELGLTEHAQTRVDKLSGGQRKRTSVALELLTQPSLLFLDEPTSGLDPGLDKQVMQTLRQLADGGRTVGVITHSVANLNVCDKVLLLAPGGKVAYFGPPGEILSFFGATDFADVFNTVTADPDAAQRRFRESPMESEQVEGPLSAPRREAPPLEKPPRQQSIPSQLSTLARRHVRVILADKGYSIFMIALPIALALVAMLVPGSYGLKQQPAIGMGPGQVRFHTTEPLMLLVFLVIGSVFMGTAATIRELVGERAIYNREKAVGLSPQAYLWGKLTIFGVLNLLQAAIMVLLVSLTKPMPNSALVLGSPTLEIIAACWFTAFTAASLGLLLSSIVKTSEQAMPALVVSIMAQLALCGGLFAVNGRIGLEQFSWLAPARWGFAAAAATTNVHSILVSQDDPLWKHTAGVWTLSMAMMLVLAALYAVVTLWRLTRKATD